MLPRQSHRRPFKEKNAPETFISGAYTMKLRRLPGFIPGKKTPMEVFLPAVSAGEKFTACREPRVRGSHRAEAVWNPEEYPSGCSDESEAIMIRF